MNNRLFLYSGLFLVLILLYDAWHNENQPAQVAQNNIPETNRDYQVEKKPLLTQPHIDTSGDDGVPSTSSAHLSDNITVVTDTLEIMISLLDGSIVSAKLLKYPEVFGSQDRKVQLLNNGSEHYIAKAGLDSKNSDQPKNYSSSLANYNIGDSDTLDVVLTGKSESSAEIIKTYTFRKTGHLISVSQKIKNLSNQDAAWRQFYSLERGDELNSNGMLYTYTGAAFYDEDDKFSKIAFSDIEAQNFLKVTQNSWISMIEHYFFTAWLPINNTNETQTIYTQLNNNGQTNIYLIGSVGNYKTIQPGSEATFRSRLFVGPKNQSEISDLAPGLDLTVDYGVLTFLAAPLFWVLDKIFYVLGNWGWSIIALTFLIKLIFFRLSETSYKSMAKMKKLTPRMTALKERYGEDRKKFSEALMKIYKEEKVNPLGGCLPILIQIPVFIALYWVIIESVEMRHAPFAGWILDLSSADPLFILPILMGLSMYIQQKLNPPPTDAMQQKIFMALPFVFTFLFATFPSGLVLYWLTNNVLSIAQQYVINKRTLA